MQIAYFPYLNLSHIEELSFGDIKIWNFDRKAQEYIPDETLRTKVKGLLDSNVKNSQPLRGVGVLSIGSTDFRELSSEELQTANEVRIILFLAFLAKVNVTARGLNAGHFFATSENFMLMMQNFDPGSDHIGQQAGFLVAITEGGYKIGQLLFHAPAYVPTPLQFDLDSELINKLAYIQKKNKSLYRRILRATDLLFESYYNDPNVSIYARILLQVSAYEVLLDLPESAERKELKQKIEQYTVRVGEKLHWYWSERRGRKAREHKPLKVMWADRFYTLRNHIIHGEVVPISEFVFQGKQSHLNIALLFFILLVKELINEKLRRKRKYFTDNVTWKKYNNGYEEKEEFVYEPGSMPKK